MRLIDLDEFLRQNCVDRMDGKSCEECKYHVLEVSCERLMEQPTIDAVEVVRCDECKHHKDTPKTSDVWCEKIDGLLPSDWYCADGESDE